MVLSVSNMTTSDPLQVLRRKSLAESQSIYGDFSGPFVKALVAVYGIELILGFTFNLLILISNVMLWKKTKITTSHILITNLHVVDLLICITAVPITIGIIVNGRKHLLLTCTFHEAFLSFASAASSAALLFTTFDRYDTVIKPFSRKVTMNNLKFIIAFVWILATMAMFMPFSVLSDIMLSLGVERDQGMFPCVTWMNKSNVGFYFVLFYVVLYLVANAIMIVCYHKILKMARTRINVKKALVTVAVANSSQDDFQRNLAKHRERKLTLMSLTIVTIFMICWGPHTIISIALIVYKESSIYLEMVYLCSLGLAYLTTCLHPLVYAFMRKQFRDSISAAWFNQPASVIPEVNVAVSTLTPSNQPTSR